MRYLATILFLLFALPANAQTLFISEYLEGASYDKALELYNATNSEVNLSGYTVETYNNGGTTVSNTIPLEGTVASGAAFLLVDTRADLSATPDQSAGMGFNGNDAVVLKDDAGTVLDALGQVGDDTYWGKDLLLRRSASSCTADTEVSNTFDATASFNSLSITETGDLGTHTADCSGSSTGGSGTGDAPTFISILENVIISSGEALTLTYEATDAEGDAITFRMIEGPSTATLDASTGAFSWTPDTPTIEQVTVVATDGTSADTTTAYVGVQGVLFAGEEGQALRLQLRTTFSNSTLGYNDGRDVLYGRVEPNEQNEVKGIYTGYTGTLTGGDPSSELYNNYNINAEHIWPQSMGAGDEPQRSDMHSLFPARGEVNSARGNMPFGESTDAQTQSWFYLDQETNSIPQSNIDAWSEEGPSVFEPREIKKGDVARAMFYFYSTYTAAADTDFFGPQIDVLSDWNVSDAPSLEEMIRSYKISEYQGAINPFVVDTTLARRVLSDFGENTDAGLVTIADARGLSGINVTIEGVIASPDFGYGDGSFYVQDETGGILVYSPDVGGETGSAANFEAGQRIRLDGTIGAYNDQMQIEVSSYELLGEGTLPAPVDVTAADVTVDSEYQGQRVRLSGVTLAETSEWPTSAISTSSGVTVTFVTEGGTEIPVRIDRGQSHFDGSTRPTGTVDLIGSLGRFQDEPQIMPFFESDIQAATATQEELAGDALMSLTAPSPNPTYGTARIGIELQRPGQVGVELYDLLGRRVWTRPAAAMSAGSGHQLQIGSTDLPAGLYLYRVTVETGSGSEVKTGSMTLLD